MTAGSSRDAAIAASSSDPPHWYDDELRDRYPTIAVLGAWVHVLTGRPAEGARWERAAQQSIATPELPDGSVSIEPWIATLRAYTCPSGIERMLADSELALAQLGPEGWWRPAAQLAVGAAHALLGDPERARPALVLATELTEAAGAPDEGSIAFAELACSRWRQARGRKRQPLRGEGWRWSTKHS